jgi:hypothetical protein
MSAISRVQNSVYVQQPVRSIPQNVPNAATEVRLHGGELWRIDGNSRWRMVICLEGEIWVTQERDLKDYVLGAGETFLITQPGLVLVQALQESCIQVTPSLETIPYAGNWVVFA